MSLAINTDSVAQVLLVGQTEWMTVKARSFDIDSYEYVWDDHVVHGGGNSGITSAGFTFTEHSSNLTISGPLTAIAAVAELRIPE